MKNLDRFGGQRDLSFRATGFFRLKKTEKRWWLVTPEGNAFLSHGVNHVERKWMERFYNIEFWARKCHEVEDPGTNLSESFMPYMKTLRFVNTQHYAEHTKEDFPDVFHEDFVGWNWCGWMDSWKAGGEIGKQHSGIQDPFGLFHPVAQALKTYTDDLYSLG